MEDIKISIPVRYSKENVGATRRKISHRITFGERSGTEAIGESKQEAADALTRDLQYVADHGGVVVAFDSHGQPWAGAPIGYRWWQVRRVAPDAGGCTLTRAESAKDLREQIEKW
jgi:hypothetical protein